MEKISASNSIKHHDSQEDAQLISPSPPPSTPFLAENATKSSPNDYKSPSNPVFLNAETSLKLRPSPLDSAWLVSKIFFWWMNGIFWKGWKNTLDEVTFFLFPTLIFVNYFGFIFLIRISVLSVILFFVEFRSSYQVP